MYNTQCRIVLRIVLHQRFRKPGWGEGETLIWRESSAAAHLDLLAHLGHQLGRDIKDFGLAVYEHGNPELGVKVLPDDRIYCRVLADYSFGEVSVTVDPGEVIQRWTGEPCSNFS